MPCRALEAFRRSPAAWSPCQWRRGLNALSGIGGVQTRPPGVPRPVRGIWVLMPCRALEAFRHVCLPGSNRICARPTVLMPCRALEAFRLRGRPGHRAGRVGYCVLMPCRALEAFRHFADSGRDGAVLVRVLMPCRALEAFRPNQANSLEQAWKDVRS